MDGNGCTAGMIKKDHSISQIFKKDLVTNCFNRWIF